MKNDSAPSALLITSAQVDLLDPSGGAWGLVGPTVQQNDVVARLRRLVAAARASGVPVIHSPVAFDYAALRDFDPLCAIQNVIVTNRLLAQDSPGARFVPGLEPQPGDVALPPRQGFSSFWANDLDARLEARGIRTLYLAGMLAHACIMSHARDAVENGYAPIVVRDATAAASAELLEASYAILGLHCRALVTTDEAVAEWSRSKR